MNPLLVLCLAFIIVGLVLHLGMPKLSQVGDRLFIAGLVAAVVLASGGCASQERNGEALTLRLRDNPKKPAPACLYRFLVDQETLHKGAVDVCPVVPLCREPK